METLLALQSWYLEQCDDHWEHTYGVRIETLDNPGWTITIDLTYTPQSGRSFDRINDIEDDHAWLAAWVEDETFRAACGPMELDRALRAFLDWAKASTEPSSGTESDGQP